MRNIDGVDNWMCWHQRALFYFPRDFESLRRLDPSVKNSGDVKTRRKKPDVA